ncbi:uncharacterized protein PV06_08045 [Exophiala oligosperma]|uniref:Uncharacterized protein n=1 Tax=Exophiala oligosperma TaxID=215243 RepID=A0A0D2DAG8_9EURO|nr:uncharacterized protein PV06_08045 [Exophiala oligosperma]KIW39430.1 hypothetical protein PV06_08045 [Exophiala oligosperma]
MGSCNNATTFVLITGANQGLGLECVKKLAAEQLDFHILLGSRSLEKGRQAASTVTTRAQGTTVEPVALDVNNEDSISQAVKYIDGKYGRLDVLLNNAGVMTLPGLSFREEMKQVIETNAISAACVTEAFLPLMKRAQALPPRLLFMSSDFGSIAYCLDPSRPFYGYDAKPYFTSKAAMNMVGAQYAVQLGREGFKVNMVDPGFRSTNLNGFHELGGVPAAGVLEACRLMIDTDKNGQHGTFTSNEKQHPW